MKKITSHLFLGFFLVAGFLVFPAQAELGLEQILVDQGVSAVGEAVRTAAEAVFAGTGDPAQIQSQLIALLNEAEATGDEGAMRYAMVAVIVAGGVENLGAGKDAINNSNLFGNHSGLVANTVSAAGALISAGGGGGEEGGGDAGGGEGGGDDPESLGGGLPHLFDPGTDTRVEDDDTKIDDLDQPATRT